MKCFFIEIDNAPIATCFHRLNAVERTAHENPIPFVQDALSSALVAYKLLKSLKSKTENTNTKLANTIDECLK